MAFARPTLASLVDRIEQDLVSRLSLSYPILRRALVRVLARVFGGAAHMLHGHIEYLSKQIFPGQSDEEYLVRQAALFGLSKTPATYSSGPVLVVGAEGSVVSVTAVFLRADGAEYGPSAEATLAAVAAWVAATAYEAEALVANGGNIYECTTAGVSAASGGPSGTASDIADGTAHWRFVAAGSAAAVVDVEAADAGQDGNTPAASPMTLESPIAGVNSSASVAAAGLSGGTDEETAAELAVRLLERMRSPPHGGCAADYVAWAKEVSGVTRAWCYPLENGEGTVVVRFVRDGDASLIPDAAEVSAVQAHIDAVRPVTAAVTVAAPVSAPLNYTIHISPDTSATRAAVEAGLRDLLQHDAEPGADVLLSHVRNAIHDSEGVVDYVLSSPSADVPHAVGEIATHGAITWA